MIESTAELAFRGNRVSRVHIQRKSLSKDQSKKKKEMASVIGKWKIEHCENFEEYMKAIGKLTLCAFRCLGIN